MIHDAAVGLSVVAVVADDAAVGLLVAVDVDGAVITETTNSTNHGFVSSAGE